MINVDEITQKFEELDIRVIDVDEEIDVFGHPYIKFSLHLNDYIHANFNELNKFQEHLSENFMVNFTDNAMLVKEYIKKG